MSEIIKTKFLCKTGNRTAPRAPLGSIKWEDRFKVKKKKYQRLRLEEFLNLIYNN